MSLISNICLDTDNYTTTEAALSILIENLIIEDPQIVKKVLEIAKCFYLHIPLLYKNILGSIIKPKLNNILKMKIEIASHFLLNASSRVETVKCIVDKAHPVVCNRKFQKCCVCSYYVKLR